MKSRFDLFKELAERDGDAYRAALSSNGSFQYSDQVNALQYFANKVNNRLFVYLFGDIIGHHMMMKFAVDCNRDLLQFFNTVTTEVRFFILYELKNNKDLFAYC